MKFTKVAPHTFEAEKHFYAKALNSQVHPLVNYFYHLSQDGLIERYVHLNPNVDAKILKKYLNYKPQYFYWGGSDLFKVTTDKGVRKIVLIETNSCPSGQKSLPLLHDGDEFRTYMRLMVDSFLWQVEEQKDKLPEGEIAVVYDKNYMECSGYAATLAEATGKDIYLIPFYKDQSEHLYFDKGIAYLKIEDKDIPIKAIMRYVTQSPWDRIPVVTKTLVFNSPLVCLAGGRNKLVANKAYEIFNAELRPHGLEIRYPMTINDVAKDEVPLWVNRFGGFAVIKVPYSNAGQGVYTVTNSNELDEFMNTEFKYDQFIVQALIGHHNWSSEHQGSKFYHVGTMPNKHGNIFCFDLRMMVYASKDGFKPATMYSRRSRKPLKEEAPTGSESWSILGTNLSIKVDENQWDSDTSRLLLMDRKDFNQLGLGIDDLIEGFIQSVLATIAIDQMAKQLIDKQNKFKINLFRSLNTDDRLISEILTE